MLAIVTLLCAADLALAGDGGLIIEGYYAEQMIMAPKEGMSAHAASISEDGRGGLVSVWYAGSREGAGDVAIYIARRPKGALEWSAPEVLISRERHIAETGRYIRKLGNPVVTDWGQRGLWVFYSSVFIGGWNGSTINYIVSLDGGLTWSASDKVLLNPLFNLSHNVKNKPMHLSDGSMVLPIYHEMVSRYSALLRVTVQAGVPEFNPEFSLTKLPTGAYDPIQPTIVNSGQEMIALMRDTMDRKPKHVLISRSADKGATWSEPVDTDVPNPNSGIDAVSIEGGLLMAANDLYDDRYRLSLLVSTDGGMRWERIKTVELNLDHLKNQKPPVEYSYPSIMRDSAGVYHLVYTYERRGIKHVEFNEAWLAWQREYPEGGAGSGEGKW